MLLRFTVENVLCFNSEASFSMVATSDERHGDHVLKAENPRRPSVLRAAALYGANGHGKSNFVNAVSALKRLVARQEWSGKAFKLDSASADKPSRIVAEFRHKGFDYEYGVVISDKIVLEEWLFRTDKAGREHMLFERTTSRLKDGYETRVLPGNLLKKSASPSPKVKMETYLEVFSSGMKETRPFLAEAEERGIELIQPAYEWFDDVLIPVAATASYTGLYERAEKDNKFRTFLEDFVRQCDVGIEKIDAFGVEVTSEFKDKLPEAIMSEISRLGKDSVIQLGGQDGHTIIIDQDDEGKVVLRRMLAKRKNNAGELIDFSFEEESSGTRRLLDLAPMIADAHETKVYVVDELDRKLHPMLSYKFVEAFLKTTKSQIIFTTHNTFLMNLDLLRRDEVWFVQKRKDGSSDLYSLAELKIRPDLNVRKGYLDGRFGAIPFLGNASDLGWSENCGPTHDDD